MLRGAPLLLRNVGGVSLDSRTDDALTSLAAEMGTAKPDLGGNDRRGMARGQRLLAGAARADRRERRGRQRMITASKQDREYADREIDCPEAMEPGFQAIVDCMLEAGWSRGELIEALRRLIAADNMAQKRQRQA